MCGVFIKLLGFLYEKFPVPDPFYSLDRISYDSYKIDIESVDPSKDLSMREVYGLDPAMAK